MATVVAHRPIVFADVFPKIKARSAVLVVGFALLTAAFAQLSFHLPWTPVPITGQTFAVLLAGGALGWQLGALSQLTYLVMGSIGLPFFADGKSGFHAISGASGGYLVGFVVAAAIVGLLAERFQDRSILTAIPAMLFGSMVVYAFGVPWLAHSLHVSGQKAIELGLAPFIIGDFFKTVVAGLLFPAAWKLSQDKTNTR